MIAQGKRARASAALGWMPQRFQSPEGATCEDRVTFVRYILVAALISLAVQAEEKAKDATQMIFEKKDAPALVLLSATRKIADFSEVPAFAGKVLPRISEKVAALGLKAAGPEVFIYKFLDGGGMEFLMGVPVSEAKGDGGEFQFVTTKPVKCFTCVHKGSMPTIGKSWDALTDAAKQQKLESTNEMREVYLKWVEFDSAENETELQRVLK